jgi:hypothetical protein
MSQNPLQQYFRQPKIYVSLPSGGVYNSSDDFQGDITNMAVFGMTGMDEIMLRTPDALLSGESTIKVVKSCCPSIVDPWNLTILDTNAIFAAIKIATFGNKMTIGHTCPHCSANNEYSVDLNFVVEHYAKCKYNNKLIIDGLTIRTQPLTYRQSTDFGLRTFALQQQLRQIDTITDEKEKTEFYQKMFQELSAVQNDLYVASVDGIELSDIVVTEREYILEFLENCDKSIFDQIRDHVDDNSTAFHLPTYPVKCTDCEKESEVYIDLDQTNFFVNA